MTKIIVSSVVEPELNMASIELTCVEVLNLYVKVNL